MQFNYKARTQEGETQTGAIESSDMRAAVDFLQRHNLILVSISPVSVSDIPIVNKLLRFFRGVKKKDLIIFSRQLAILIEAKVPLLLALRLLAKQTENEEFRKIIYDISSNVEGGMPFSAALSNFQDFFSVFYVNLIRSGETSGNIEGSLVYLADHLESEFELEQKVKGALTYPAFIMVVFIAVGIVFLTFVVPKITAIYQETGQELPFLTRALITAGDAIRNYWWLLFLLLFAGISALRYFLRKQSVQTKWDSLKLKLPILGSLFKKIYLARFAESLNVLILGGVSMVRALNITAEIVNNNKYKNIINAAADRVKTGESISSIFSQNPEFMPPMVVSMISIGEQTGRMDMSLKSIARFYNREIENTVANLSSVIEPAILVVFGGAAALLVMAILLPIFNLNSGG